MIIRFLRTFTTVKFINYMSRHISLLRMTSCKDGVARKLVLGELFYALRQKITSTVHVVKRKTHVSSLNVQYHVYYLNNDLRL